ncbi:hypothetical protein J2R98_001614 [Alkalibacillus filiformis]|uniref:Uncharacterized protein n=1 Tax=Alkalibacillus filiformis TaxID=200990 RepID=A0ABU0DTK6_9BACI|nr:hypothetical protein [Alkalibacillus filiformis]MDQ0351797.1 hypothetical protein [Alkalibacillus filiformis]
MPDRFILLMNHLKQLTKQLNQSPQQKYDKQTSEFYKWEKMLEGDAQKIEKWMADLEKKIDKPK